MKKRAFDKMNDDTMQRELLEGEKLLWQGAPEPFSVFQGKKRSALIMRWIICAVGFIALTLIYTLSKRVVFNWVFEAVILLAFAYVALVPVLDTRKVVKKCSYYVTDMRAVTIIDAKDVLTIQKKNTKLDIRQAGEGCVHIMLGAAVDLPEKKWVYSTFTPICADDNATINGLIFYNVKDSAELRDSLKSVSGTAEGTTVR